MSVRCSGLVPYFSQLAGLGFPFCRICVDYHVPNAVHEGRFVYVIITPRFQHTAVEDQVPLHRFAAQCVPLNGPTVAEQGFVGKKVNKNGENRLLFSHFLAKVGNLRGEKTQIKITLISKCNTRMNIYIFLTNFGAASYCVFKLFDALSSFDR